MAVEKEASKAVLRRNGAASGKPCAMGWDWSLGFRTERTHRVDLCGRRASVWWHRAEKCSGKPDEQGRWTCRDADHYVAVCRRCARRLQLDALADSEKLEKPINTRKTFDSEKNDYRPTTIRDLNADEIRHIRGEYRRGDAISDIARSHGISYKMTWKIVNGLSRMDVK